MELSTGKSKKLDQIKSCLYRIKEIGIRYSLNLEFQILSRFLVFHGIDISSSRLCHQLRVSHCTYGEMAKHQRGLMVNEFKDYIGIPRWRFYLLEGHNLHIVYKMRWKIVKGPISDHHIGFTWKYGIVIFSFLLDHTLNCCCCYSFWRADCLIFLVFDLFSLLLLLFFWGLIYFH